jgi:hypothetical protein
VCALYCGHVQVQAHEESYAQRRPSNTEKYGHTSSIYVVKEAHFLYYNNALKCIERNLCYWKRVSRSIPWLQGSTEDQGREASTFHAHVGGDCAAEELPHAAG